MGHAAVLPRGPATLPRDVRRDQPEHSPSLETERATSRDARQKKHAVARRHDAAERAHHAGHRCAVPQCCDDQRPGARVARLRTRRPSQPEVGEATLAWHVLEFQEARQVLEGAPQPCYARGQHAPAVHQALLADGQARSQRRPRPERRRDFVPAPRCIWGSRRAKQAQLQGNAKEATTFTIVSAWTVARWTCWCRSCTSERQTPSCRSTLATSHRITAGLRRPRSCSSRPVWTTC